MFYNVQWFTLSASYISVVYTLYQHLYFVLWDFSLIIQILLAEEVTKQQAIKKVSDFLKVAMPKIYMYFVYEILGGFFSKLQNWQQSFKDE